MKLGVLGTGVVGQAIAAKLASMGHEVMIGTRDVGKTRANTSPNQYGGPPFSAWLNDHPAITLGTFADAASFGEMILLCTKGDATLDIVRLAGTEHFSKKPVVDISNPLDFSKGMPPSLFIVNTNSLAEEVQRAIPDAHVVKTLNIVNCEVMVDPSKCGGQATMLLCGNNADAKATVRALLRQFGWQDIVDLGDITGARGMEMMIPIWVKLFMTLKNPYIAFKIQRT